MEFDEDTINFLLLTSTSAHYTLAMQAIPWPVSPEFEDALVLATQRHLAQPPTAPSTPHQHSLDIPSCSPDPESPRSIIPRSSSLMMKTRVAVRDKTPHRFQVVPLRDAAQNREKSKPKLDSIKQPPAPWARQLALLRPSGVGLGLNMVRCGILETRRFIQYLRS
jgi:hypothetical protein